MTVEGDTTAVAAEEQVEIGMVRARVEKVPKRGHCCGVRRRVIVVLTAAAIAAAIAGIVAIRRPERTEPTAREQRLARGGG